MRVLVTGADGQVGTELRLNAPEWVELIALNSRQLDITDRQAVEACMAQYRPQLIINAAACGDRAAASSRGECVGPCQFGTQC